MILPFWAKICFTLIGVTIAIGNGTVFVVYFSNRQLRTMTNYFVLSLAVSDFLAGTILLPLHVWSPDSKVLGPLIAFILTATLSNISGCTYDRYIAIHKPLRYQSILTKKRVYMVILVTWSFPLCVAVVPQIWLSLKLGLSPKEIGMAQKIYVALMSFGVLITSLVLIGIYLSIFFVAKRHFEAIVYLNSFAQRGKKQNEEGSKPNIRSRRFSLKSLVKDVKATKLVAIIGAAFAICWLPLIIINIFESLGFFYLLPPDFETIAFFTIFCNSLGDPFIYAFFQQEFRVAVTSFIRKSLSRNRSNRFHVSLKQDDSFGIARHMKSTVVTEEFEMSKLHLSDPTATCDEGRPKRQSVVNFAGVCS